MENRNKPSKYGQRWNRDELILAFELYCLIPFKTTKANNPKVQELAALLDRTPDAIARKLGNFGAFDPELQKRDISGLEHGSKLDRQIWDEFHDDWNGLVVEAWSLRQKMSKSTNRDDTSSDIMEEAIPGPSGPSERLTVTKTRIHQSFFRKAILSSYENTCCITGISIPECLTASHILPWSLRAYPKTGTGTSRHTRCKELNADSSEPVPVLG